MAGENARRSNGSQKISMTRGWDTDKWVALLVLASLALLIAIRMGFRGVNVLGVRASVS